MSNLYALHKAIEAAHMSMLLPTATSHGRFQEIFKHHAPLQRDSDDAMEHLPENLTEAVQDIAKQMSIHVDSYIDSHEYGRRSCHYHLPQAYSPAT